MMRKMRRYRDYLIEKLSDREKAISYLQTALEEYQIDGDGAALHLAFSHAVEAQGGVQEFALRTHSGPQAVSDALLSKDETQIARVIARLAEEGCEGSVIYDEAKRLSVEDFIASKSPYRSMPVDNILTSIPRKYGDKAIAFNYTNHSTESPTLDSLDGIVYWESVRWDLESAEGQNETQSETQSETLRTKLKPRETLEDLIHALNENRLSSRNVLSKELKVKSLRSKSYYLIEAA